MILTLKSYETRCYCKVLADKHNVLIKRVKPALAFLVTQFMRLLSQAAKRLNMPYIMLQKLESCY